MTTISTMQGLAAICESFAQGLLGTFEHEEWRAARDAREGNDEIAALSAEMKRLSADFRLAKARRDPAAAALEQRYAAMQTQVQTHPAAVRQQVAAQALIEMLREANKLVSGSLGVDFAATAAPRQGGCCG